MQSKKKVLFFVSPFFGGASRMTVTIAKLLDRREYDVKFVVFGGKPQEILNFIPKGYEYVNLSYRNIWDFVTMRMVKLFRKERPDIVFCSFRYINVRVLMAAKIVGGIRTVLRNENGLYTLRWDNKLLVKFTYPMADCVIAQQEEMRDELVDYVPQVKDRVVVCHNYLDTKVVDDNLKCDSPYKINSDEIRFVWAGRVTKEKGYEVLLKAFNIVKRQIPNAHLYLLGKYDEHGNFYNELKTYIVANKLESHVHFEGLVPNPHVYEKYADCFVLPSFVEGLPNALVEAMYIGVPVVATKCIPMISRMVDNGQNGYLVEVGDFEEMAEAMQKAILLKDCHTIYKPSTAEEYTRLFK